MANAAIGSAVAWLAIRTFVEACTGIPRSAIYQAFQNSSEIVGAPASVRVWADNGPTPASSSWQKQRALQTERWRLQVLAAEVGGVYAGEAIDLPFSYTAVDGDDAEAIRDQLLAALPVGVVGAASGDDALTIAAAAPGAPLAVTAGPAELLALTRTATTAVQTAAQHAEWTVQVEVVSEIDLDDPDTGRDAVDYLGDIEGKLAQGLGPYAALRAAGVYFMRYAMPATNLTALDRQVNRSRARMDIVFSLDVQDLIEFDRVVSVEAPVGVMTT